jgi:predicted RNA binding protein YcfA (HicA-like mRNA interferase family)
MRLPRDLSGRDLVVRLERVFSYRRIHQVGSHVVLQTQMPHHRIAIPDHEFLRIGTLNSILRAVGEAQGITKEEVFGRLFD